MAKRFFTVGPIQSRRRRKSSFHLGRKWQLAERSGAIIQLVEKARHQQWVRAESVKAYRRPTLLEDNPTSG